MADGAVDILDAAADDALDVMVVVADAGLVAGRGAVGQVDPRNDPLCGKIVDDPVNRLQGNGRQHGPHALEDCFRIGMRVPVEKFQRCNALTGCAQPGPAQFFGPARLMLAHVVDMIIAI